MFDSLADASVAELRTIEASDDASSERILMCADECKLLICIEALSYRGFTASKAFGIAVKSGIARLVS